MTQAALIKALQNGSKNTYELEELTGMSKATIGSTAKKLRYKGDLAVEYVKVNTKWIAKYTLTKPEPKNDKTIICGIQTYGIFTPTEYRVMAAQARRLYGKPKVKEITNNQFI